ncbi:MAG: CPBP family intramembrane metalloprotease [Candidatus Eisenbacteria bacterium]|nr:CPBP family intramembrane metalloprotease [Candidatus Eisenbacteria bacterium]
MTDLRPRGPGAAMPEPFAAPQPPTQPPRSPIHPYARVALFLLGYLLVAVVLSLAGMVAFGVMHAFGLVALPAIDEQLLARGTEGIMEWLSDFMLPTVILLGLYSIGYTWAFVRLVDGRRLRTLGLERRPGWSAQFWKGVGLSFVILLGVFLLSLASGAVELRGFARPAPDGTNAAGYLVGVLAAFLLVGFYEELMFRGYVLQTLNERAGRAASVIVSSAVFAVMHGVNPGANAMAVLNIAAVGALLSFLFFRTGALWMPIGFHFGWNFLLGYVFTLPVSGLPLRGILDVAEATGAEGAAGRFGPESSLVTTLALGVWAAWLIARRSRRHRSG